MFVFVCKIIYLIFRRNGLGDFDEIWQGGPPWVFSSDLENIGSSPLRYLAIGERMPTWVLPSAKALTAFTEVAEFRSVTSLITYAQNKLFNV